MRDCISDRDEPMNELTTETRNERSTHLDSLSTIEIVELMNSEDALLATAVAVEKQSIAQAIDAIVASFQSGGRLFYIGAGTSGRLGVLDASECPPTFNTPAEMVVGIIAVGDGALRRAIEGAEDSSTQTVEDLAKHQFSSRDTLIGIASSGGTTYVLGGLDYAKQCGAVTVGLTCKANSKLHQHADIVIAPVVGPEVLSGSTRLKAGTATKMVLNMLTTGAMVKIGKTYGNLMVDLRASNNKLRLRSISSVGFDVALNTIGTTIRNAYAKAGIDFATAEAACLSIAGAGRAEEQKRVLHWCALRGVAHKAKVVCVEDPAVGALRIAGGMA